MLNASLNTVIDLSHPWWPSRAADHLRRHSVARLRLPAAEAEVAAGLYAATERFFTDDSKWDFKVPEAMAMEHDRKSGYMMQRGSDDRRKHTFELHLDGDLPPEGPEGSPGAAMLQAARAWWAVAHARCDEALRALVQPADGATVPPAPLSTLLEAVHSGSSAEPTAKVALGSQHSDSFTSSLGTDSEFDHLFEAAFLVNVSVLFDANRASAPCYGAEGTARAPASTLPTLLDILREPDQLTLVVRRSG